MHSSKHLTVTITILGRARLSPSLSHWGAWRPSTAWRASSPSSSSSASPPSCPPRTGPADQNLGRKRRLRGRRFVTLTQSTKLELSQYGRERPHSEYTRLAISYNITVRICSGSKSLRRRDHSAVRLTRLPWRILLSRDLQEIPVRSVRDSCCFIPLSINLTYHQTDQERFCFCGKKGKAITSSWKFICGK